MIRLDNISKQNGHQILFIEASMAFQKGEKVGLVGPNGSGKTTLFRMITRQETPDKGTITTGESVHLGYVDQSRDSLDGKKTVWEEISGGNELILLGKREVNSRGYCSSFNFKGADQQKKVGALSGGERNRVHMAKMLKSGANVLLLDEPTSALDPISTLKIEELVDELKRDFTIIIVTHNMQQAGRCADQVAFFYLGELVEVGSSSQIFTAPRERRTQEYITGRFG